MKSAKLEHFSSDDDVVMIGEESASIVTSNKYQTWNLKEYLDRITIIFKHKSEDEMDIEFDLIHVNASIANAIRRVLIAEVPSMAIEKVFLYQNTSVIPDEVLCHRLGLLPVYANPNHFNYPPRKEMTEEEKDKCNDFDEEPAGDPKENIIFEVRVKCKKKKSAAVGEEDPEKLFDNAVVRSKAFKWIPIGKQSKLYYEQPLRMVCEDIVVAKLRPGQEIEARCHCVKGVGRDHAKFSPVATASYRMLPEIILKKTITGEHAKLLKSSFSPGVIAIDKDSGAAYVKNARKDTCSRNVFQHEELKDAVEMGKNANHFIFTVESTGAMKGHELTLASFHVIQAKLRRLHGLVKDKLENVRKE